jgi:hypothetical protein
MPYRISFFTEEGPDETEFFADTMAELIEKLRAGRMLSH